jgi:hypothetical protein
MASNLKAKFEDLGREKPPEFQTSEAAVKVRLLYHNVTVIILSFFSNTLFQSSTDHRIKFYLIAIMLLIIISIIEILC